MYWLTVGDIHFCSRRYPEAIQSFHEALLLELQSGIPLTLASLQLRIARALLCSGRYRQADALLDKCAPVMDQAWARFAHPFWWLALCPLRELVNPRRQEWSSTRSG